MRKLCCIVFLLALSAAALDRQPNADYRARRLKLSKNAKGGAVLVFAGTVVGEQLYGFRQDDNFFYLTGWTEPGAALLLIPEEMRPADPNTKPGYTEILFLPAHNVISEKYTGPKLGAENPQAPGITGVDQVEVLDKLRDQVARLLPRGALPDLPPTLYVGAPDAGGDSDSKAPLQWLRRSNAFGRVSIQEAAPVLTAMRMTKDAGEMERMRRATDASIAAHLAAMHAMRPGMNEHDISALMQYEYLKRGCERPAYAPIVGAGKNSTILHYDANSAPIRDGDVVLMDVAGEYGMYASDITRTLPANGHFSARQREIYNIVLGAQRAAEQAFKAGKSMMAGMGPDSLFKVAYDYINSHGKDLHGQPLGQYFVHGLGHHLGLNVHDPADYSKPLDRNMVFTLEPGIYIPEEKLGVRIEDDYWVDGNGNLVQLTQKLPHTADAVEKEMANPHPSVP
jgi:Xaa-Pro aminopeptidase